MISVLFLLYSGILSQFVLIRIGFEVPKKCISRILSHLIVDRTWYFSAEKIYFDQFADQEGIFGFK